jgi:hypothetical protein
MPGQGETIMSSRVFASSTDAHYPRAALEPRLLRTSSDIIAERDRRDFEESLKAQAERLYRRNSRAGSAAM